MRLSWLDPVKPDERDLDGLVALLEGVRAADVPFERPRTVAGRRSFLRHGWDGDPPLVAVASVGDRVVGMLRMSLPRRDNTHLAEFDIAVDPLLRRRGLGRQLLDVVIDRARQEGRRTLLADPWTDSPGPAFCAANGFRLAYEETMREQSVLELDPDAMAALWDDAERHATGYELVTVVGATPEELLPDVAVLTAAINDAPTDTLDIEDEVYDADRVGAFERAQLAQDRRLHRVLARHRVSRELAGLTIVAVDGEQPWGAAQYDTSVARAHRGRRLGLLLKVGMLRHLATAEPQLRTISTWNADSNAHMVRVNELLGYRVAATASGWQRHL
jgi:GNAT superfamily N-acetyltransferase